MSYDQIYPFPAICNEYFRWEVVQRFEAMGAFEEERVLIRGGLTGMLNQCGWPFFNIIDLKDGACANEMLLYQSSVLVVISDCPGLAILPCMGNTQATGMYYICTYFVMIYQPVHDNAFCTLIYSGCCSDEIIQGREGYKESPLWWPQGGGQRKVNNIY